jgi:1-acyl-sn-glycerol-3-phosphate acyltransferase
VVRLALTLPVAAAVTLASALAAAAAAALDRRGRWPRAVAGWWGRALLAVWGIRVEVAGHENVPPGPAVFAANHGSALDIPLVFGHLPVDFRIIHKRSLYLVPIVGLYLWLAGHIGIDRGNPFRARRSLESASRRIARGTSVVVFPEGTRSPDESVQHFKRGSFVLALAAGVPVVPVSLAGVKRVAPGRFRELRPGRVRLVIHPARATVGRAVDDAATLAEEVRLVVRDGCAASC